MSTPAERAAKLIWEVETPFMLDEIPRYYAKIAAIIEEEYAEMESASKAMKAALVQIGRGEGAFSTDPLTHASNTIEESKIVATNTIAQAEEAGI